MRSRSLLPQQVGLVLLLALKLVRPNERVAQSCPESLLSRLDLGESALEPESEAQCIIECAKLVRGEGPGPFQEVCLG